MQRILRAIYWILDGPGTVMNALHTFSPAVFKQAPERTVFALLRVKKLRLKG